MASTSAEAYGLPSNAPPFIEERPLGEPSRFAIFHTVPMDKRSRQRLEKLINRVGSGDANHSKLAPTPDFTGCSLRDMCNHFIAVRESDESVQPFYFIVTDNANFQTEGVLGICLDCNNGGDGDVGVARCPVDMVDGRGAGLYYGLAEWEETQEAEQLEYGPDQDPEQERDTRPGPVQLRSTYGSYSLVEKGELAVLHLRSLSMGADSLSCTYQSNVGFVVA
ncbi:hypothetical protein E8E12_008934 [Didymella heteroderae]|uniref:Uncharacterized protein n=1 Tax=Didymella heteroderae TaxID=1769908 RepID=A0A9P5C2E7_9PLEO|nr:hypothetical protein E8E12_008934 [Didymella heteroderae]